MGTYGPYIAHEIELKVEMEEVRSAADKQRAVWAPRASKDRMHNFTKTPHADVSRRRSAQEE